MEINIFISCLVANVVVFDENYLKQNWEYWYSFLINFYEKKSKKNLINRITHLSVLLDTSIFLVII